MASIYIGHFWGYAVNNNYGDYDCYLQYDSVTRSGTTVTMNNARLYLYHDDYGYRYTTNRLAYCAGIAGSGTNVANNVTFNERYTHSAGSYTLWLGSPSTTTTSTSFSFYVAIASTGGSYGWDNFMTTPLEWSGSIDCPAAGSSMGTTSAGSTLSGPTINVTKYSSGFTDNISLSYNNKTITRNNFSSSKLSFSEAERLLIFQAQGAGQTRSWSISGNTYSGGTWVGSFSGSVNITTEALSSITTANNFNVEDNTSITVNSPCGGTYTVAAKVTSTSGTEVGSVASTSGSKTITVDMSTNASDIYNSNISTKTGTIYWIITSSINGTPIGSVDTKTCTYTFLQSRCGPTLSTLKYAITDAGTRAIMGSSGSDYNYNDNTDLGKLIESKTTLRLKLAGSAVAPATISKYYATIPGQSSVDASGTSGTVSVSTQVLDSSGTIYGYIRDSRGFESSLSFSYLLNEYFTPSAPTLTVTRNQMSATNPTQDRICKLTAVVSFPTCIINSLNDDYSVSYLVREAGGQWPQQSIPITDIMTVGSNSLYCTDLSLAYDFDQNTQYEFRLQMSDYYTTVNSQIVQIPISAPLLSKRYKRFGINKIPTHEGLDVAGDISTDNNLTVAGTVAAGGNKLLTRYTIDATSLDDTNFYPVTFPAQVNSVIDCEIHSPSYDSSANYNQNVIHFHLLSNGYSDLKRSINVLQYGVHTLGEVTIGCVGCGTKSGYTNCVWIRGGFIYQFWSNFQPTLHTTDYTAGSSPNEEVFTVGTSYSGGTNTNVEMLFTPGVNLTEVGSYCSGQVGSNIINTIYPVGSIYMSVNSTDPGILFGGTWVQIKGRFLLGQGQNESNTSNYWGSAPANTVNMPAGELGGEYTHLLTANQSGLRQHSHGMDGAGSHNHAIAIDFDVSAGSSRYGPHLNGVGTGESRTYPSGWVGDHTHGIHNQGPWDASEAHSNMPPYLVVYMWKRTA